jgi:hypothetical protein
MLLILWTI